MKLVELAEATATQIECGDAEMEIHACVGLEDAGPSDISFLTNPKYTSLVSATKAGAIFLGKGTEISRDDLAILRAEDAHVAYALALRAFNPEPEVEPFVHPSAVIDPTAKVAGDAAIYANVVIGPGAVVGSRARLMPNVVLYANAVVGDGSVLHSGVSVREDCEIGRNCVIHNNSTIGSDGFGYARTPGKKWLKVPQAGRVVVEDDVEIGANTAIDRASIGDTRIARGAKIDNLVQIGHSCTVDEDALICAQTGLAGSSDIGKRVILAGQVGIAGHLKVGDDAVITAKSATSHDVEPGKTISGIPAFDNREWLRSTAAYRKLGEIAARLRKLERKVLGEE